MDNQELETTVKELKDKVDKLEKNLAGLFGHVSQLSQVVMDNQKQKEHTNENQNN